MEREAFSSSEIGATLPYYYFPVKLITHFRICLNTAEVCFLHQIRLLYDLESPLIIPSFQNEVGNIPLKLRWYWCRKLKNQDDDVLGRSLCVSSKPSDERVAVRRPGWYYGRRK